VVKGSRIKHRHQKLSRSHQNQAVTDFKQKYFKNILCPLHLFLKERKILIFANCGRKSKFTCSSVRSFKFISKVGYDFKIILARPLTCFVKVTLQNSIQNMKLRVNSYIEHPA
jgi:hypothetical protein